MVNIRLGAARNSWGVGPGLVDLRREPAPSSPVTVTARPQTVTLDLGRTAIIVVDMQNDFCHPDGWLASIGVDVAQASLASAGMFVTPTLCGRTVDTAFRDDESYVSGHGRSLGTTAKPYSPTPD